MSEEIKEILDGIKIIGRNDLDYLLRNYHCNLLLDYINNLQRKVEELENIRKEAIEYLDKKLKLLPHYMYEVEMYDLLNILNKGSENDVKKDNTYNN